MKPYNAYLACFLLLSGCGIGGVRGNIHNRTNDYLEAHLVAPLKVPTDLEARVTSSQFDIPEGKLATKPVSVVPPGVF